MGKISIHCLYKLLVSLRVCYTQLNCSWTLNSVWHFFSRFRHPFLLSKHNKIYHTVCDKMNIHRSVLKWNLCNFNNFFARYSLGKKAIQNSKKQLVVNISSIFEEKNALSILRNDLSCNGLLANKKKCIHNTEWKIISPLQAVWTAMVFSCSSFPCTDEVLRTELGFMCF